MMGTQEVAAADMAHPSRLWARPGTGRAEPADCDAVSDRATAPLADLVEPAKSTALDKLGEGERALSIAAPWLRTRLGRRRSFSAASGAWLTIR
jgi:hypothetical protein